MEKLAASQASEDDLFGHAVAISGEVAVVGSYLEGTINSGAVYVYNRQGNLWLETQRLVASDPGGGGGFGFPGDQFGRAVDIDGQVIVVGAWLSDDACSDQPPQVRHGCNSGAAYVFEYDAANDHWEETAKLLPGDRCPGDRFGSSVAVHGDIIVVGAHLAGSCGDGTGSGAAYIFRRIDGRWTQEARLDNPQGQPGDHFGAVVAVHGPVVAVGSRYADLGDPPLPDAGAVFVHRWTPDRGWQAEQTLHAPDAEPQAYFGGAVAAGPSVILIGARGDDGPGDVAPDSGAAYAFEYDGSHWFLHRKLRAYDAQSGALFGSAVALAGGRAMIGAYTHSMPGVHSGAAYVFLRTGVGWLQQYQLLASDGEEQDWFGYSIAADGDNTVVGAIWEDDAGRDAGAAYVFSLNPAEPCDCLRPGVLALDHAAMRAVYDSAAADPPVHSGYIDPLRESTDGVHLDQGPTRLTLLFTQQVFSPGGGPVGPADFEVWDTSGDPAPQVTAVDDSHNPAITLVLDRPATPLEWTTVRAEVADACGNMITPGADLGPGVDEPDRVDIAFLPGDVDQSGQVTPMDFLRFQQQLFSSLSAGGCPDCPHRLFGGSILQYFDIDRSASLSGIDMIHYHRLLDGIPSATQPWAGASLRVPQP